MLACRLASHCFDRVGSISAWRHQTTRAINIHRCGTTEEAAGKEMYLTGTAMCGHLSVQTTGQWHACTPHSLSLSIPEQHLVPSQGLIT